MTWSWAQARHAAGRLRRATRGAQAAATIRPRSVVGLARSRAPLPLLLYVAARDGLVVEQSGGGFAVLQRPAINAPIRSGGYGLRLLRWLDRRWDLVVFGAPALLCLLVATASLPFGAMRVLAVVLALGAMLWVSAFLTAMMAYQLRWVAAMGARSTPAGGRAAASLPAYQWSVPLLHQPDLDRLDDLMRLLTQRLVALIGSDLQKSAGGTARVGRPDVTETLVILTRGISTDPTRTAVNASLRAIRGYPADGDVVVLMSPGRLESVPRRPTIGGEFLLLYLFGLAVVIAVCAVMVASTEAQACLPASCEGRPATYTSALRWLLQRLLFSDPPGLAPGAPWAVGLGLLVSAASAVGVLVAFVAGRQEIRRNRETKAEHEDVLKLLTNTARVVILVVTAVERDAVLESVRRYTGRAAVLDHHGERTIYTLGPVAGAELMLAQASEQGTASAAGMMMTARAVIEQCRPDYVILTGICYGLWPDEGQRIGDVVVARRVQNIDHRKLTERDGSPATIQRGVNVGCSPVLLDRFQAGQASWSGGQARVHIGTVLTSNALMDSKQILERLRADFPDAIAGEMEGTGVHEAATWGVKPDWIMVKAISDWGYDKTDDQQPVAARNAADFVTHVIAAGRLYRKRDGSDAGVA